jgi:hypothetical protein
VKSDYEIARELAPRVGLAEEFSDDVEDWKRRLLGQVAGRGASLDDLRIGAVRSPVAQNVIFADRRFGTRTGKVNLITDFAMELAPPTNEFSLLLMAFSTEEAQASQWLPGAQEELATATVHPGAAPGFEDDTVARIESELGSITVRLRFDSKQRRDVVLMPKGGWLSAGRCANALVRAQLTDAGGCAVYYDTPVRVVPAR